MFEIRRGGWSQTLGWFALALAARSRLAADLQSSFFINDFAAVTEARKDAESQPRQIVEVRP